MESSSKKQLETPDVIVINCDDAESKFPDKNIRNNSYNKREVSLHRVDNLENIFITQNVHVKEQKIQCVINLTTNVCKNQKQCPHNETSKITERIVPKCFRPVCQPAINNILKRNCRHKPRSTKNHRSHKKRSAKSKKRKSHAKSCKESKKKNSKKIVRNPSLSLSSVSLSPFVSDISYEDISLNSFPWCSDSNDCEIDELITKARQRERRRCVTPAFLQEPLFASTPVIQLSSDVDNFDDSIHSLETYVLGPRSDTTSSNISSTCIEVCEEDNKRNSLPVPTIDLTDTRDPKPYCLKKNNSMKSKTKPIIFIGEKHAPHSEMSLEAKRKCENHHVMRNSLKSFETTKCKPTSYGPDFALFTECSNSMKIKTEKIF